MNKRQRCPECSLWLDKNSDECYCGWQSSSTNHTPNHQCVYSFNEFRCPYDGSNCQSICGNGVWYCVDHKRNLRNPKRCQEIILEAQTNFESIMDSRIDWRIKLIPEEYAARKALISEMFLKLNIKRKM